MTSTAWCEERIRGYANYQEFNYARQNAEPSMIWQPIRWKEKNARQDGDERIDQWKNQFLGEVAGYGVVIAYQTCVSMQWEL
jgi:hypothetical protein